MREITKSEAENRAKELATPLSDFIGPSEVQDGAEKWSDIDHEVLREEAYETAEICIGEASYAHTKLASLLYDRAITVMKDDLPRVPMKHLTFENRQKAVAEGYWPYKMTHGEVIVNLQEIYTTIEQIPTDAYQVAYEDVSRGYVEGTIPNTEGDG